MSAYSPFDKPLKDLGSADLQALTSAMEGWYIEYKREVPASSSIAKSLSAFANTYGGWLLYGVQEKSKEEPTAGSFPGIPRLEIDAALQKIRQAASAHVAPAPHFDYKVIWGPENKLGLPEERAVICINVPWSPTIPHVHKNGLIYRRIADGSEPKAENDRFVLDQLWQRSEGLKKEYRKWIDKDPEFSKEESKQPYIRLLLDADLWQQRDAWIDINLEEVRAILGQERGIISAIPFDTVYISANGFIARQLRNNDPHYLGLTWFFMQNLVSEVIIPLKLYSPDNISHWRHELDDYENIDQFLKILKNAKHVSPRIVDLSHVFSILMGVVETQRRLLKAANWTHGYFAKARVLNVWRTVPFVDSSSIIKGFEKHGVPMCLNQAITTPGGETPETFKEISNFNEHEQENIQIALQTLAIFFFVAYAFGLPAWISSEENQQTPLYYEELMQAGARAMNIQARHNK